MLKVGAAAVRAKAPLNPMDVYLVRFHAIKHDPRHQMGAHHYCTQVNEDFAQCVVFDGNTGRPYPWNQNVRLLLMSPVSTRQGTPRNGMQTLDRAA